MITSQNFILWNQLKNMFGAWYKIAGN